MEMIGHIDINDIEALKVFEYGLLMACPLGSDPNPRDCPFYETRKRPIAERFNWVDELSDEKCVEYYQYHIKCFTKKKLND